MIHPYFMVSDPWINFGYPSCLVSHLIMVWSNAMMRADLFSTKVDCLLVPKESKIRKNPLVNGHWPPHLTFPQFS